MIKTFEKITYSRPRTELPKDLIPGYGLVKTSGRIYSRSSDRLTSISKKSKISLEKTAIDEFNDSIYLAGLTILNIGPPLLFIAYNMYNQFN